MGKKRHVDKKKEVFDEKLKEKIEEEKYLYDFKVIKNKIDILPENDSIYLST